MAEEQSQFNEINLTVPWGHVAARTYGSPMGEPVLMVHGLLDNAGSFTRLMKYLPMSSFYYVCIDLPGHGWSTHMPSWSYIDLMSYTYILHLILEELKWKTCIYIGHSLGGQLGLIFSAFQPHRIKKIISLDAFLTAINTEEDCTNYLKNAFVLFIKDSNVKPMSYTKEEILYALKNLRSNCLNSEAADALFERAITEVNGKYIYNRDIRLGNIPLTFMNQKNFDCINRNLSVPIYIFIPVHGFFSQKFKKNVAVADEAVNPKILEIIHVDGNHDVHNNDPEKIAPLICNILINRSCSKL